MASIECSASIPGPNLNATRGSSMGGGVLGKISALDGQADFYISQGEGMIQGANAFQIAPIPGVNFTANLGGYDYDTLSIAQMPAGLYQGLATDPANNFDDLPSVNIGSFQQSTMAAPVPEVLQFPDKPPLTNTSVAPVAPDDAAAIDIPSAPNVSYTPTSLPTLGSVPQFHGDIPDLMLIDLEEPDWVDIPLPSLSPLDREPPPLNITPYHRKIIDEAVAASWKLLDGDLIIDLETLDSQYRDVVVAGAGHIYSQRLTDLWSRRGVDTDRDGLAGHVTQVQARYADDSNKLIAATRERLKRKMLPQALQLAAEAYEVLAELFNKVTEAEFEILAAKAEVIQNLYARAVAQYKISLAQMRRQVAAYQVQVAKVRAEAMKYLIKVDQQKAIARLNKAVAQGYAATQKAKEADVTRFEAKVEAAKAAVKVYNEAMRGVQAQAQAVGARLAKFQADSATWVAEVEAARNEYRLRSAENKAIIAENKASAAMASSQGADVASVAAASALAAVAVTSDAAQLRATIMSRLGENLTSELHNMVEGSKYRLGSIKYKMDAAGSGVNGVVSNVENSAIEGINSAIARFATTSMESTGRAAELTQKYQVQMAQAYVTLAESLSSAWSSVASGKLGRYRATRSQSLAGTDHFGYRSDAAVDYAAGYNRSQSNSCVTTFRELKR